MTDITIPKSDLYMALWGSLTLECMLETLTVSTTTEMVQHYWPTFEPWQQHHFLRILRELNKRGWPALRDKAIAPYPIDQTIRPKQLRDLLSWCESNKDKDVP